MSFPLGVVVLLEPLAGELQTGQDMGQKEGHDD